MGKFITWYGMLWRKHWPEFLVLFLGFLSCWSLYWWAQTHEVQNREARAHEALTIVASTFETTLHFLIDDVRSLAQFYAASDEVNAREFIRFAQLLLERHPIIHALEWVPRVNAKDRITFETRMQAEGLKKFTIWEYADGKPRTAEGRSEYFPVLRVAPLLGYTLAPGFDQGSDPARKVILKQAWQTKQPQISEPLLLNETQPNQLSLMIWVPQISAEEPEEQEIKYRDQLKSHRERKDYNWTPGLALGIIGLNDLLKSSITSSLPIALDIMLWDISATGEPRLLVSHVSSNNKTEAPVNIKQIPAGIDTTVNVAGRSFQLRGVVLPEATAPSMFAVILFWLGMTFSCTLALLIKERRAALFAKRQAAKNLRESEERLRLLIEHAPAALAMFDHELRYLAVSERWCQDYGLEQKDILGQLLYQNFPEISENWKAINQRGLNGETIRMEEDRIVRQDGSIQWLRWVVCPWYNSNGKVAGIGIFSEDITQRKLAEQTLRRYQQIVETAGEMLAFYDYNLCYKLINPAYAAFLRADPIDLIGHSIQEIDGLAAVIYQKSAAHLQATQKGESRHFTIEIINPEGNLHWLEVHQSPFCEDGIVQGIVVSLHDQTDERNAQLALKAEREHLEERVVARTTELQILHQRLQLATESGEIGVWEWEIETNRMFWDAKMHQLYGINEADFEINYPFWLKLIFQSDLEQVKKNIESALHGEQEFRMEFRINKLNDDTVHDLATFSRLLRDPNEKPVRMIGVSWEITELKRAREAAEQSARAKEAFLAQMSHEIRTPLNGLLGLTELALRQPLSNNVREYLEQALQAGQSLLGILNDILDHAKIESGSLNIENAPFARDDLLTMLRSLFAHTAANKGIQLIISTAPEVPEWLCGDALRLRQLLANLLSNALKFTERGQISLKVNSHGIEQNQARLTWIVEDTGIGMDQVTLARLFQPFQQGDDSIARRFGGTGLGLCISRNLALLMGGELTVTSVPEVGSTFILNTTLQLAQAPASSNLNQFNNDKNYNNFEGARILVAEDQAINQRVIGDMLRLLSVNVTFANTGKAALECLAELDFDAILMDIQMPELDGLSATRQLRENPTWAQLPVIALTAGVTAVEREQIAACGMSDLLPKPVNLDALRTILQRWLKPPFINKNLNNNFNNSQQNLTLPGFDLRMLQQITNNIKDLHELLREFAKSIINQAQEIADSLAQNDFNEAQKRIHRLKGVSGNFGAIELYQATIQLEETVQQQGSWPNHLMNLQTAHANALARIAALPE